MAALTAAALGAGGIVWLLVAHHPGGPLADAWEQSRGSLCVAQPAVPVPDLTVELPINPGERVGLEHVRLVGAHGVHLVGAYVVDGPGVGSHAGWSDGGEPVAGAVVGAGTERTLRLHLRADRAVGSGYDDVRIDNRQGLFAYSTGVGTGLRVAPAGGCA
ncbi:hypothetical protein [Cellulomonas sp. HZM]|uniref:hypothetical protein n=1 Tax=Cellulomonas sp. HZM TaxID=1454010 RepID=UPI000493147D|nr:hypothetical protein [Cellulomonas sp. HZM]